MSNEDTPYMHSFPWQESLNNREKRRRRKWDYEEFDLGDNAQNYRNLKRNRPSQVSKWLPNNYNYPNIMYNNPTVKPHNHNSRTYLNTYTYPYSTKSKIRTKELYPRYVYKSKIDTDNYPTRINHQLPFILADSVVLPRTESKIDYRTSNNLRKPAQNPIKI